jgi:dTDP-4-amino-4,6-dideoxygalactose transaminase
MAALLLDLAPGDEVIMPSFTFASTANAFVLRGAVPVFVDIRPDTLNIDHDRIAEAVTAKTRAVVAVHYGGEACTMDAVRAIAWQHNFDIVEDAAHALLSEYRAKPLGTIGRFGTLSFHATKNVTCGQGGALLLNEPRDVERAEVLRDAGTGRARFRRGEASKYVWESSGSSYLLSELASAYLFGQFEQAQALRAQRLALCSAYRAQLAPLEGENLIQLPAQTLHQRGNGHVFYVVARDAATRRDLIGHLRERGIEASFHYMPLHTAPAGLRFGRVSGALAVTERIAETIVRLPLFASMTDAQVDYVCEAVRGFYLHRRPTAVL